MRPRRFDLVWRLLWPLRLLLRVLPSARGRALVERLALEPLLPPEPESFVTDLPLGAKAALRYRERIGFSTLLNGMFESAELKYLAAAARPGTVAIDAGANVGLFSVTLGKAVGREGRVLAFEPSPETAERLRDNVELNQLENVDVIESALGADVGEAQLLVADDPAYSTTTEAVPNSVSVPQTTLDATWRAAGTPPVSVVKIDVEGEELSVVEGGRALLESERPTVLVEAASPEAYERLRETLARFGYEPRLVDDFMPWNHVFTAPAPVSSGSASRDAA
jgi:FkbM family methyltransferase